MFTPPASRPPTGLPSQTRRSCASRFVTARPLHSQAGVPSSAAAVRRVSFPLKSKNPGTESHWPASGPTCTPEPIPVARGGMKEADWPDLSHRPAPPVPLESTKSHRLRARVGGGPQGRSGQRAEKAKQQVSTLPDSKPRPPTIHPPLSCPRALPAFKI